MEQCAFFKNGEKRKMYIFTLHAMSVFLKGNYLVFSHIMILHIIEIQFNISNFENII